MCVNTDGLLNCYELPFKYIQYLTLRVYQAAIYDMNEGKINTI